MMRKWMPVYTAAVLIFTSLGSVHAARSSSPPEEASIAAQPSRLEHTVARWTSELAKQPGFEAWKTAKQEIMPLGPGLHGWYVQLASDDKVVGYLVVQAKPDGGYKLGEYGTGGQPLYDEQALYRSMVQLELIPSYSAADARVERRYLSPLLAVWRVTLPNRAIYYFDAKSGEYLPIEDRQWTQSAKRADKSGDYAADEHDKLARTLLNPSFDPYIRFPWLTKTPLQDMNEALSLLEQRRKVWYSAEPYGDSARYVWPTIGAHVWGEVSYFAVDQQGVRMIPSEVLAATGQFFD
ncbi:hypothetical protein IDH44_22170 [Paenibacillus sp. IB182496]|uniref:Uncharacterized protein n=1 Tax=Paenibacillus sabuli TaxID=2772509 RepID=A0A927BY66_9BACL|nr:hypothetical protein [Paenibacillus sabuli]MBD2847910.1 hypothetical protein [Paenibacillus sabuli]